MEFAELDRCAFLYLPDALHSHALDFATETIIQTATILEQPTCSIFGSRPNFRDMTFDVSPYCNTVPRTGYSRCVMCPKIETLINIIATRFDSINGPHINFLKRNLHLFNANLSHFPSSFPNGGSRGKYSDNIVVDLSLTLIYSIGFPRVIRIYEGGKIIWKHALASNSILALVGPNFQKTYKYSIAPLPKTAQVGDTFFFNIRYA